MNGSAVEIRDELWETLESRLEGDRRRVYDAIQMWGPCTTRQAAEHCALDLLTVRPRATELLQVGLIELCGKDGHEGQYRAVRIEDAIRRAKEAARPQQMQLL